MNQFIACKELGVNYALYSAFPFVERMVFGKAKSPVMPFKWMQNPAIDIPVYITGQCRHVIQDSGLFTLLFGARKNLEATPELIAKWYDNLVQFTLDHGQPVTCVEVDCQNLLGMDAVWQYRERMAHDLPDNRIINVFHLRDGAKELDRLIEFSEYIAISVPEFKAGGKLEYVSRLTRYIKRRKPTIDIHLLGCTEGKLLRENSFCTSSDSTSYTASKRFGFLAGRHVRNINPDKVRQYFGEEHFANILKHNNEQNTCTLLLTIEKCRKDYIKNAGNQD